MVTMQAIEKQLQHIGSPIRYWGRAELRELQHILTKDEEIKFCLNGRYEGGFALLCVTDLRILLVDRKLFYLTLEDIRYDMIIEVDYNYRLMDATVSVFTPNKTLKFTCYRKPELRKLTAFVQRHVMDLRHLQGQEPTIQNYDPVPDQSATPITKPITEQYATASPPTQSELGSNDYDVSIQKVKTFMPKLPLRRRVSNVYTNTPLSIRRSSTKY